MGGMRIENTTLGALLELSDAQLIIIRERWYGLNDHAPITAVYELRREKDGGFVGEGRLSTALSETRVVPVTVSRATVSELLRVFDSVKDKYLHAIPGA